MTMRSAYKLPDSQTTEGQVILFPFPSTNTNTPSSGFLGTLIANALSNPEVEKNLKSIIEAAIVDASIRAVMSNIARQDNPFDAIYISELKTDSITKKAIHTINNLNDIEDLSNHISFNDGWDE